MLIAIAVLVTVAAAVRSTWSPCGVSMLSTLTPMGERSRGTRFGTTATWFVLGATLGGVLLGGLGAALAALVRLAGGSSGATACLLAAAGGLLVAALADTLMAGRRAVGHHRQVNERWLDHYRPWVYGAGFGLQIGTGLGTYVVTAAVYLVVVLGALTGQPALALGLGALFGLLRGLAVLLGRTITTPQELRRFHARFSRLGTPTKWATVAVELAAAALVVPVDPLIRAVLVLAVVAGGAVALARSPLLGRLFSRTPSGRSWGRRPVGHSRSRAAG